MIKNAFQYVVVMIFSFSYSFFLFLSFSLWMLQSSKIYFVEGKIFLAFPEHKKEKLFLSEKEKIFFDLLLAICVFWIFVMTKFIIMEYRIGIEEEHPKCLECGDEISYGRSDKKFCSDECRNRHHNTYHRSCRNYKRKVAAILDKNYEILENLVNSGVKAVWVSEIIAMGYNPAYVTSYKKHGRRSMCHCYDICYIATDNRMTSIAKIQNLSLPLQAIQNDRAVKKQ